MDEQVESVVGVLRHEVASEGREGDGAPVCRERQPITKQSEMVNDAGAAVAVGLPTMWSDAHPLRRAKLAVADEDVQTAVGVARDEVAGVRGEGDEAPVRRERQPA